MLPGLMKRYKETNYHESYETASENTVCRSPTALLCKMGNYKSDAVAKAFQCFVGAWGFINGTLQ